MRRIVAILLVGTLVAPGCATRGPALTQATAPRVQPTGKGASPATLSPDVWRQFAEKLPAGAKVHVHRLSGRRLTGVILTIDDEGLVVNPKTRVPEPTVRVAFDDIRQLELANDSSLAKAAAVGAGVGAGAFLGLMLLLFTLAND